MDAEDPRFSSATRELLKEILSLENPNTFQSKLLKRISDLRHEILALQHRRNYILFPNRLPDELLSKIFLLHAQSHEHTARMTFYGSARSLSWIRISHVCKRWRMVAIASPLLWSDLNFTSPHFAAIMLERSKNAPLYVQNNMVVNTEQSDSIVSESLSHSDRLKSVELFNPYLDRLPYPALLRAMGKSAPLLEKITLSSNPSSPSYLPEDFTMGGAPSLKHLELRDLNFRWDNIPLGRALTSLYLHPPADVDIARPRWETFLLPLSEMRHLENLKLHRILPSERLPRGQLSALHLPIVFPSLQQITVEDTTRALCDFFQAVNMHQTTQLSVFFYDHELLVAADIDNCISNISTAWHLGGLPTDRKHLHSFAVLSPVDSPNHEYDDGAHMVVTFANTHDPSSIHPSGSKWSLTLREVAHDIIPIDPLLASLTSHLDFSQINEIQLDDDLVPRVALENRLAALPMRHFILNNYDVHDLLQIMECDPSLQLPPPPLPGNPESDPSTPTKAYYFPALETLKLPRAYFRDGAVTVDLLISALKRRLQANPIKHLRINGAENFFCRDQRMILNALPTLEFEWDGCDYDGRFLEEDSDHES